MLWICDFLDEPANYAELEDQPNRYNEFLGIFFNLEPGVSKTEDKDTTTYIMDYWIEYV